MKSLLALPLIALATPAVAQHSGHAMPAMPGMPTPVPAPAEPQQAAPMEAPAPDPHAGHGDPVVAPGPQVPAVDPHAGHVMPDETTATPDAAADPHAGHDMSGMQVPTDGRPAAGNMPAPAPPTDYAADAIWGEEAGRRGREALFGEVGELPISALRFELAEVQLRDGQDSYRWEGMGFYGNATDRVQVNFEGEGEFNGPLEQAEAQLLYARALDPFFNLVAGVRQDFRPSPSRTYLTVGIEGLAPYWFHVRGEAFVSHKGDFSARFEGSHDVRITQRIILQPRVEADFQLQDVPELGLGSGLTSLEAGLRLRYEFTPRFAPYIGYEWAGSFGDTANFRRLAVERVSGGSFVAGVAFWF